MMQRQVKLSIIVLTYNEEEILEQALKTALFADEIIIVDSNSTDKSIEIAKKYTQNIFFNKFLDFSSQKNFALSKAKHDWVYMLDADEVLSENLQTEIIDTLNSNEGECIAYRIKYAQFFMNRFLKYGTSGNDKIIRLMNKNYVKHEGLAHEKLILDGKCGDLKNKVFHYTYRGFNHYINKIDKTAWFKARELQEKNTIPNLFHFIIKPFYRFFHEYVIKRGFLDGIPGLISASINSYGVFTRYVKLRILINSTKKV